jgi:hypothetical protein
LNTQPQRKRKKRRPAKQQARKAKRKTNLKKINQNQS